MDDSSLHNFLARAAWVLADARTYLQSLPTTQADILCERIDDYFSEAYSWLKSHPEDLPSPPPSSAPTVEKSGLDWKPAPGTNGTPYSSSVTDTLEPIGGEFPGVSSPGITSGGGTTKRFTDFF